MSDSKIKEKVKQIVYEVLKIEIDEEDDLFERGLNSINVIEIIVLAEDVFNIEFSEESLSIDNLKSLSKISRYVANKLKENM